MSDCNRGSFVLLEDGLYELLMSNATFLATGAVVYLNIAPENATDPCLVISKVSAQPDTTMDGPSGLNSRRYQFSFFSKSYITAIRLQETVRIIVDGFHGPLPTGQMVWNIIRENELDGFDDVANESYSITDYFIQFTEVLSSNTVVF